MSDTTSTTRAGLGILGTALGLGLAGNGLLRALPWGLNTFLWIGLLLAAAIALARYHAVPLTGGGRWLLLPAVGFAAAVAWRDSPVLLLLNLVCILVALGLAAAYSRAGRIRVAGCSGYALALLVAAVHTLAGPAILLLGDVKWRKISGDGWVPKALPAVRGLILALPLVLVFGGLLMAADAVFASIVARIFSISFEEAFVHLFLIGLWSWLGAGFLRQSLIWGNPVPAPGPCPPSLRLGAFEYGIVLGSLDALFAAFVLIQLRYFFGGPALVEASATLSYAEYARSGFFELVAVAALTLPLLLLIDWTRRREGRAHDLLFSVLAGVLVGLLAVIMASAVQRMLLYQREFGLTELRVYTTAFMGWLALVFLWFVATILRGRRERFAFGALLAGFVVVVLLNFLSPDDLIIRVNAGRVDAAHHFDGAYAASLSADAVPSLIQVLPHLPESEQRRLAQSLRERWSPPEQVDWRNWNWARLAAWKSVAACEQDLRSATGSLQPARLTSPP